MTNFEKYYNDIVENDYYYFGVNENDEIRCCNMGCLNKKCLFYKGDGIDCDLSRLKWLFEEYEPPLLTNKEKTYLENVLRPFRNEDIKITKKYKEGLAHIFIEIGNCDGTISFPNFVAGARYNNIAFNICYTSKDLGLFEGEEQ